MPVKMEILTEFDEMKSDFKRIDCNIRIRECSECDLDLDLQLWTRENFAAAFSKMLNWNRILLEKYPIWLDVLTQKESTYSILMAELEMHMAAFHQNFSKGVSTL